MSTSENEYSRALSNPDNFIVSDELQDLLGDEEITEVDSSHSAYLLMGDQRHVFTFVKMKRTKRQFFVFKGKVPSFPVLEYLRGEVFSLSYFGENFSPVEEEVVSFDCDGILTFTARRIISNEKVSV